MNASADRIGTLLLDRFAGRTDCYLSERFGNVKEAPTLDVIASHLDGRDRIGIFPNGHTSYLGFDFDGKNLPGGADEAFRQVQKTDAVLDADLGLPALTLELTRSGKGYRGLVFFDRDDAPTVAECKAFGRAVLRAAGLHDDEDEAHGHVGIYPHTPGPKGIGKTVYLSLGGILNGGVSRFLDPVTREPLDRQETPLEDARLVTRAAILKATAELHGAEVEAHRATVQPAEIRATAKSEDSPLTLTRPKDSARHDLLRSYTMRWANAGLGEIEIRTFAFALADAWGLLAENRGNEVENLVRGAMLKAPRIEAREAWTPATLEGVTDPNVGHVEYIVDRLIPRGEVVGIAATFKSGKSLAFYSLLLAALRGDRAFGMFVVPHPLRVVVFQEEMPSREDNRRLRRLAIGKGMDPADLLAFVASRQLVFYNRVGLDLSTVEGVARFHDAVRAADADLVILDSLIAAAGEVDIDKNGPVRRMFTAALLPLTTEGRSIVFLHHKRKGVQGARGRDADRDSFLGAQAIAAASGRMYSLERLDEPEDAPKDPTRFRCALTLFGSWTPEEAVSTVLETRDDGDGTTVTALDDTAQVRAGGVNAKQRAALALTKIVGIRRTVNRKSLIDEVASDLDVSSRTVENGLAYAKAHGWIETEAAGRGKNEMNVIPGERLGDAC